MTFQRQHYGRLLRVFGNVTSQNNLKYPFLVLYAKHQTDQTKQVAHISHMHKVIHVQRTQ